MGNIPASDIVDVNPGVIAAGGTALDLSGLVLTNSTQVPIGAVQSFPTAATVSSYFGASSPEATLATVYFNGFDNSALKPAAMLFAQYPSAAVPAYLRGGSLTGFTLAQLQALTGTVIVTINGIQHTSSSINLSGATSFSNAATLIQTALAAYDAVGTGSITTTTMTITGSPVGTYAVGQVVSGSGVTAGTKITAILTGTGGAGTYTVTPSQTAASTTISAGPTLVTFDSVSGAFVITGGTPGATSTIGYASGTLSPGILLTQAAGAVLSQGSAIATPIPFMTALSTAFQNFAGFMTLFEPITADKISFANWTNGTNNRFFYSMWDTDVTVTTNADTASAGYAIQQANYSGTIMQYAPSAIYAAFVLGTAASIDFSQTNGRVTFAFRSQAGLNPVVTSEAIATQLIANGYNFYGSYATAADQFVFFYPGQISGPFDWADTYLNQIWLNNNFQLSLMLLLVSSGSIPYNSAGYALIEAACADPINAALNFGAIRAGVTLSTLQKAEINAAAGGKDIATVIQQRGWYLLILDASPTTRQARQSPPMTFFYTDGESVQQITLASLAIQ